MCANPLSHVETFRYYLDAGNASILEKMKKKDMVIIEPVEMATSYIQEAQQSGTIIYGYINAMEADKWNKELIKQFNEEAFFHGKNGKRKYIPEWDAYLMDISNQHYQDVLLKEIKKRIVDKELNGVFLDTVGSIEDYHSTNPDVMKKQQESMKGFMQRIKKHFPNLSIAQNWGFDTLEDYTAPYVDFIMWEDFSADHIVKDDWYDEKITQLKRVRDNHKVEIFTISFREQEKSRMIAAKHGFKIFHNPDGSHYNKWVEETESTGDSKNVFQKISRLFLNR